MEASQRTGTAIIDANQVIPTTGRLLLRKYRGGGAALVGVLFFPRECQIIEGATYPIVITSPPTGSGLAVLTTPLSAAPHEQAVPDGVQDMLETSFWPRSKGPELQAVRARISPLPKRTEVMGVRFLKAFPEDNGWTLVAALQSYSARIMATNYFGHAWIDVRDGALHHIPAPMPAEGEAIDDLLSSYAMWPDVAGVLHSVPIYLSTAREDVLRYRRLLAEVGRGERTLESCAQIVRAELQHVAHTPFDPDYAHFLAELDELDGLHLEAPMTLEALEEQHAKIEEAARRVRRSG